MSISRTSSLRTGDDTQAGPQHRPGADVPAVRRLLSSWGLLALSSLGGQVLGFIGLTLVARRLGPHNLGAYGFANSLSGYFALPLMAGVTMIGIRELALSTRPKGRTVAEVQSFLMLNGLLAYGALVVLTPLLTSDPLSRALLPLTGLTLLINPIGLDWAMQGMQRLGALALYRFLGQLAYLVVLVAVLTGGAEGAERYALCNALGFGVTAMLTAAYVWRALHPSVSRSMLLPRYLAGRLGGLVRGLREIVRRGLAASLSLLMIQIYYSVDFVLLGYLQGNHAVGEYTAASRLPLAVVAMASLWVTTFYPHAAALFRHDKERLRYQVGWFTTLAAIAALPLIPFGFAMGAQIVTALFGQAFSSCAVAFAILLCSAGLVLVSANVGQILLACREDKAFLVSVTVGAVLNVALNLALIPEFGIEGSAVATLIAEGAVIVSSSRRLRKTIGTIRIEWNRLVRALLAGAGASGVLLLSKPLNPWWGTLLLASLAYAILVIATHAVRPSEIRHVLRAGS